MGVLCICNHLHGKIIGPSLAVFLSMVIVEHLIYHIVNQSLKAA